MQSNQQQALSLLFTYEDGHTATTGAPGDVPQWTQGGDPCITLEVAPDGLTANAKGVAGQSGTAVVSVNASDNATGQVTSSVQIAVTAVSGKITSVQIIPGDISAQ